MERITEFKFDNEVYAFGITKDITKELMLDGTIKVETHGNSKKPVKIDSEDFTVDININLDESIELCDVAEDIHTLRSAIVDLVLTGDKISDKLKNFFLTASEDTLPVLREACVKEAEIEELADKEKCTEEQEDILSPVEKRDLKIYVLNIPELTFRVDIENDAGETEMDYIVENLQAEVRVETNKEGLAYTSVSVFNCDEFIMREAAPTLEDAIESLENREWDSVCDVLNSLSTISNSMKRKPHTLNATEECLSIKDEFISDNWCRHINGELVVDIKKFVVSLSKPVLSRALDNM